MNIGIDIDNTLIDLFALYAQYFQQEGFDVEAEDFFIEDYAVQAPSKGLPGEFVVSRYSDMRKKIWPVADMIPGARAVIALLQAHNLHIITARRTEYEYTEEATTLWMQRHGLQVASITYTGDKGTVAKQLDIDIMIEDSVEESEKLIAQGIPVLLRDLPQNRDFDHELITRFSHWAEVPRLIARQLTN